jgi:hypothetical protein
MQARVGRGSFEQLALDARHRLGRQDRFRHGHHRFGCSQQRDQLAGQRGIRWQGAFYVHIA